jgi:hypothetical protein
MSKLKHPSILAFLFLVVYLSPNIFFPESARFLIHDNLDSNVVWYKMLAESHIMFAPNGTIFPNIYGGIPRGFMPLELNLHILSYMVFSPLVAYNLNIILLHIVAFIGMYILLRDYVFKGTNPIHVAFLSLSFAVLPFWPSGELSIAGQPLILWAFLNLLNTNYSLKNWLIICLLPFDSMFILSNLFLSAGLFILILAFYIRNRKFSYMLLIAWALFIILSAISVYRLFIFQLVDHVQTQRTSFVSSVINLKGYLKTSFFLSLKGQYHFNSLQWPLIVVVSLCSLFFLKASKQKMIIIMLLIAGLACALISNVYTWGALTPFINKLGALKSLQLRFTSMLPLLWHLIFAFCIYLLLTRFEKFRYALLGIIILNILLIVFNLNIGDYQGSKFAENAFYSTYIENNDNGHKTFKDYYCDSAFSSIKNKINYSNEVVLCIGFPSEIAQYNKVYTAAAYFPYLPIEKKQALVNIFLPELKKLNDTLKENEVINSRRFQYYVYCQHKNEITDLSLDSNSMQKMGIRYVFSSLRIGNSRKLSLDSICCISNNKNNYPAKIIVYKTL